MANQSGSRRWVDLGRLAVFVAIVFLIGDAHKEFVAQQAAQRQPLTIEQAKRFFPTVDSFLAKEGTLQVFDAGNTPLGRMTQTAPQSDASIGFSGSTNVLLAFGPDEKVVGLEILESGDTKEHLDAVLEDDFLANFKDRTIEELGQGIAVEGVSGATLTSMAIAEGISARFGSSSEQGNRPSTSLRFPNPISY